MTWDDDWAFESSSKLFMHSKIHHFSISPLSVYTWANHINLFPKLSLYAQQFMYLEFSQFLESLVATQRKKMLLLFNLETFFAVIDAGWLVGFIDYTWELFCRQSSIGDMTNRANFVLKHPVIQFNQLISFSTSILWGDTAANAICIQIHMCKCKLIWFYGFRQWSGQMAMIVDEFIAIRSRELKKSVLRAL